MAPIPTVQNAAEKRTVRPLGGQAGGTERRSELVVGVKYCSTLPDIPFDTKCVAYPFGSNRFVTYSTTSLEKNYTYEVLTEPDLGVDVELVVPDAYSIPKNAPTPMLDPTDERLLEEDALPLPQNQKRSRHHAKRVSWLRRTEYISTEQTRFQPQTIDKVEAKVGYSVKKMLEDDLGHYMDRDSQIKSIEKTFEDSLIPIDSHFAKPGVTPVEILPIFPDFKLWKYPCAQVIFDSDPAPVGRPIPAQLEEMSQAMIRGVMDESGEQFVAYFLPTEETLQKRKRDVHVDQEYDDEEVYEYRMAREYNWTVKSKQSSKVYEENYFFVIRDDGVYYNELETRVRLNKRRVRGPNQLLNTKLCVKHIPMAASDYKFQRGREKELELQAEEDDVDEEEKEDKESSDEGEKEEEKESSGEEEEKEEKESSGEEEEKEEKESSGEEEEKEEKESSGEEEKEEEKESSDEEEEKEEEKESSGEEKEEKDEDEDEEKEEKESSDEEEKDEEEVNS